jgi:hypothetical protein
MRAGSRRRLAVLSVLAFSTLTACMRMGESSIKMPANPVLTGGLGWGVVKDAYVRLKESPAASARDLDHLRRGGVFALESRVLGAPEGGQSRSESEPAPTIWYGIASEGTSGWVRGNEIETYASKEQADKAAEAYR